MFVTSISEVAVPGIFDLLDVLDYDGVCLTYLSLAQSDVDGKFNFGLEPKFRFSIGVRNMHVYSRFFPREKE